MKQKTQWLAAAFFLLLCPALRAQTTVVTGTVTDPNGVPYAGATIKAQLTASGATVTVNSQQQCASGGYGSAPCQVPIPGTYGPTPLDGTGTFSLTLYDNTQITPASTQYIFTVSISPGVAPPLGYGPRTCTSTLTISGSSQSISTQLSAACPALSHTSGSGVSLNWQRLGTVIGVPNTAGGYQEVSVFIQTSPQVLSSGYSQVVGMLMTGDSTYADIYYAEAPSPAGPFTFYSSAGAGHAPTPVLTNAACASNVQTLGGQLVMFACASRTDIHRYHSTTHGISWVDDGAEISHGGGGWKNGYVENPYFLLVNGTCHLWFEGATTSASPLLIGQGHATSSSSTCAHGTFTEDAGDPVIPTAEFNGGGPAVYWSGSAFYQLEHGTPGGSSNAYPTNIYATQLNSNGSGTLNQTHTEVFQARYPDEGANQSTATDSQVADPFLFEWPNAPGTAGNWTYLYYTSCAQLCTANEQMSLKVAVIQATEAAIVTAGWPTQTDTAAQVQAVPFVYGSCGDTGTRANGNPGPFWGASGGSPALVANVQIASNTFETTSTTFAARTAFNGCPFPPSQYSQAVFAAGASTSVIGLSVLNNVQAGDLGAYEYELVTAGALGTSQTMVLRKIVSGTPTNIATFTATPAVNDVWKLTAIVTNGGITLTAYQNGTEPSGASGTDTSPTWTTGQPGVVIYDSSAVTNAQLKNWQAGPN